MILENGAGNGNKLKINGRNEAHVFSISESEAQAATEEGDAYNINTGDITLTTSTSSALLYFKNDEEQDVIVEAIALGFKNTTCTDTNLGVYVVRNPSTGTIIDDASAVGMNQNRNFGSSKTLKSTTLAYKASAQSKTFTNGDDIILINANKDNRTYAGINIEVPRGSSIGIRVDSASLATTAYAALIIHVKDGKR